jgi:hypothetical protein
MVPLLHSADRIAGVHDNDGTSLPLDWTDRRFLFTIEYADDEHRLDQAVVSGGPPLEHDAWWEPHGVRWFCGDAFIVAPSSLPARSECAAGKEFGLAISVAMVEQHNLVKTVELRLPIVGDRFDLSRAMSPGFTFERPSPSMAYRTSGPQPWPPYEPRHGGLPAWVRPAGVRASH